MVVYIAVPRALQSDIEDIVRMVTEPPTFNNGEDFAADEREVYHHTDRLGDKVIGQRLQVVADSNEMREAGRDLGKSDRGGRKIKDQGLREVHILTMRGGEITIRTPYFSRNCDLRSARGRGVYPVLLLLGIYGSRRYYTPALAHHVVLLTTAMGSIDEARRWLAESGVRLCVQTIQTMTYQYAQRVRASQQVNSMTFDETLAGRRVVISVDGGRIRVRRKKRGRKSKKGRTCFYAEWREPKLLMIYVVDESGRIDRTWSPMIDGLLKPNGEAGDAIFGLLKYYLERLEIAQADTILFVADGARWIWALSPRALSAGLGVNSARVRRGTTKIPLN